MDWEEAAVRGIAPGAQQILQALDFEFKILGSSLAGARRLLE
jgi:hypothetical protein